MPKTNNTIRININIITPVISQPLAYFLNHCSVCPINTVNKTCAICSVVYG